jgi:ubiquinone/menaquinone biosynthesis C-methylase UbiE
LAADTALFLDRRSRAYVGGAVEFLLSPLHLDAFRDLAAAVRRGGTFLDDGGAVAPENPIWVKFARAMAPMMVVPAESLAGLVAVDAGRPLQVLDIAAGHGLYGLAFARRYPKAHIAAVDWPNVLEVASENARAAGVGDRYRMIPGSAFDVDVDGGADGYDLVLLTNLLHHFDAPTCERLMRKIHGALADGGRVATVEFVPNDDRVSPPIPATFALIMLGTTPGGDAYTFKELEAMFRNAGYSRSELHELPPTISRVVISYK